jgi:GGDEF domain-containing protein
LSGRVYDCRGSIGISLGPLRDDDPGRLLDRADSAMYLAKRSGGGRFVFAD